MTAPLIVAHRGASKGARGNSLEAFENAIAVGAEMIEFDVRRTRDDVLVAFHDRAVAGRPVGELTHAEMTETLGRKPPTLEQVLTLTRERIKLDIELKEAGYVLRVLAVVGTHFRARRGRDHLVSRHRGGRGQGRRVADRDGPVFRRGRA